MTVPRFRQIFIGASTVALVAVLAVPISPAQDQGTSTQEVSIVDSLLSGLVSQPSAPETSGNVIRGRCESRDNQRSYCEVDTSAGVRLVRQLSQSSCTDNWGFDAGGIWVDKGCRAEFEVGVPAVPPTATPEPANGEDGTIVVCESLDGKRAFCSADTSNGVELARSLAESICDGHWGYNRDGIWVNRGCRAEFRLPKLVTTSNPTATRGLSTLVCQSTNGRMVQCGADTSGGVRLLRQLNGTSCRGNWGYDSRGVWVTRGCRAEFEVTTTQSAEPTPVVKQEIKCRARSSAPKHCPAEVKTAIRLVREISTDSCLGNWGFDEHGIWVDDGCHAVFIVE